MELGDVAIDAERACADQLVLAIPAGEHAHAQHVRPSSGEQIPDRIADDVAVLGGDSQPPLAFQEEIRLRLGPGNVPAVHHHRLRRNLQRLEGAIDLRVSTGGCDPMRDPGFAQKPQQSRSSGKRRAPGHQRAKNLPVPQLERAQLFLFDRVPQLPGHGAGEQAAAHSNLAVDAPGLDLHVLLDESLLPSEDVGVDRIDEGPIEIENQSAHSNRTMPRGHRGWQADPEFRIGCLTELLASNTFRTMVDISLDGRTALVTGGSRGIGRATALLLARAGASVAVAYQRDERSARDVVESISHEGGRAVALRADLAHWSAAEQLVNECTETLGPIGILVANHGIWKRAPIDQMTEAEWDEMAAINLKGVIALCRYAAAQMRARHRGTIILISSTAGQRGEAEHSHYAATKGALISLTKSLAPELARDGIRVNCVAPGWVETDMVRPALSDPSARAEVDRAIPLRRLGQPEEIAGAVLYLASDLSTFVTGEILNVNGGAVLVG